MNTKTWVISQLDTAPSEEGLTDVVKTIHWRYQATETVDEKTYNADIYGSMACATPSETDFTAYPDLTEAKVIEWLEAELDVEALGASLDAQIEAQKNPPIVNKPLPWVPVVEVVTETTEESALPA
jgi:hypothetical protein